MRRRHEGPTPPPPAPDKMDLDAWLTASVPLRAFRDKVRAFADDLGDLLALNQADLEASPTLGLAAWPALSKDRFLRAWRRLKDGEDASSEPQRPRSAPVSAAELAAAARGPVSPK